MNDFEIMSPLSDGSGRIIEIDGVQVEDEIMCDQSLWMDVEGSGCWTITGCAHSGRVNTLDRVMSLGDFDEVYAYIGGTHLVGQKDDYIMRIAEELRRFGLKLFSPCHCTGFNAMSIFRREFREEFAVNYCGRVFKSWEKPDPMVF